jgi:hypothetical protein
MAWSTARCAIFLAGGFAASEYTKIFVEKTYRSFISSRLYRPRVNVLKTLHQGTILLNIPLARSIRSQPFAKGDIQSFMLSFRDLAGSFDKVFIGAKSDVLHEASVH